MSFYQLNESDVILSKFIAYPSYSYNIALSSGVGFSSPVHLFLSAGVGQSRSYIDINGDFVDSSEFNITGNVEIILNSAMTSDRKRVINRLRNIYASASFIKPQNYESSSIFNQSNPADQDMAIINIPAVLYGSEIKPGSFYLSTSTNHQITDDSRGGLYSGSNLVGCVFYQHGIAYLGQNFNDGTLTSVDVNFSGTSKNNTMIVLAKIPRGELNFSTNPSYTSLVSGSTFKRETTTTKPKTFVTTVGLYDDEYKLVGVAKISSPILNEETTGILFRLKLNF